MPDTKTKPSYSKQTVEVDGLWHARYWHGEVEYVLGTFPTELEADRATEDAIARAMYAAEHQAADDKVRAQQAADEEARIKADNERQTAARSVPDKK